SKRRSYESRIFWYMQGNPEKPIHIKDRGIPFRTESNQFLECPFGPPNVVKEPLAQIPELDDHPQPLTKKRKIHRTKKLGCSAEIHVKEVVYFTNHFIDLASHSKGQLKNLKAKIVDQVILFPSEQQTEHFFYMAFPKNHSGHPIPMPIGKTSDKPTGKKSARPSGNARDQPTGKTSGHPTGHPTGNTRGHPTGKTSGHPTGKTSGHPTGKTSCHPT
ncbi:unnamed protein product, partial [Owenia fusiformis]